MKYDNVILEMQERIQALEKNYNYRSELVWSEDLGKFVWRMILSG